jgi:hypothetical protein
MKVFKMGKGKMAYLLARAERLQSEIEAQLEKEEKYSFLEQTKNGSVIKFNYQFNQGGIWYTYAAIKVRGDWYTSGPQAAGQAFSDDDLQDWWERGKVKNVKIMGASKKIDL